jgi:hypothetical protein
MSGSDIIYLRELLDAGYTANEVRNWGAPEYRDDAGEVYFRAEDVRPWLDDAEGNVA